MNTLFKTDYSFLKVYRYELTYFFDYVSIIYNSYGLRIITYKTCMRDRLISISCYQCCMVIIVVYYAK